MTDGRDVTRLREGSLLEAHECIRIEVEEPHSIAAADREGRFHGHGLQPVEKLGLCLALQLAEVEDHGTPRSGGDRLPHHGFHPFG